VRTAILKELRFALDGVRAIHTSETLARHGRKRPHTVPQREIDRMRGWCAAIGFGRRVPARSLAADRLARGRKAVAIKAGGEGASWGMTRDAKAAAFYVGSARGIHAGPQGSAGADSDRDCTSSLSNGRRLSMRSARASMPLCGR
jgi:hypothetical protein